jgi:hypothetical protein
MRDGLKHALSKRVVAHECKPRTDTFGKVVNLQTNLHRAMGNTFVSRITPAQQGVQTKLKVSEPGDQYEREADRVADRVMRIQAPPQPSADVSNTPVKVQRKCEACECEDEEVLRRKPVAGDPVPGSAATASGPSILSVGQPMDAATRNFFEPRFGRNLSGVRIHTDTHAARSAKAFDARAYTYGRNIVFDKHEYQPGTDSGRRLLAHELAHVAQQDKMHVPNLIARNGRGSRGRSAMTVSYVVIYLDDHYIDFHTSRGTYRYYLDHSGLVAGEYSASAVVEGNDVDFTLNGHLGEFEFTYRVDPGQPNPSTFFAHQSTVLFNITGEEAPEFNPPEDREESEEPDPNVTYLTLEEALRRCESGDLPGVKVFPYRGTRFGGAPIMAHRDGEHIVVKQPVYVLGNDDFRSQTRTLPTETFIGGVRLQPNEIVRVHTYEPRWYHLNITGSTSGNVEDEFCVTGTQMLEIAEGSTNRTIMNIGLTVVEAALFFVPVGRIASFLGRPVMQVAGRSSRNLAAAIMLGMREASPTAFAGIASRTGTVLVEQQAVNQVAGRAITETVAYATVEFSEQAVTRAATSAAAEGVARVGGERLASEAVARTVIVTVVDAGGSRIVSTLTTPTGDVALDATINQAFDATFDMSTSAAGNQAAGQGVVTVAPEVAAGFAQVQVQAFRRFVGRRFSDADIQVLEQLWDDAARAGDNAILNPSNSRYLFDLQRNRFWARVRANDAARALFEDAGCQFSGGAPYYMLNGRRVTMTIDHIIERQTAPQLSLTASNLRISFSRENSVVLRLLTQLDPFQ